MKKAGLTVGITLSVIFIAIAVFIFIFINREPKVEENQNQESIESVTSNKNVNQGAENTNSEVQEAPVAVQEPQVVEKVVTKEISGVKTISEGSLSNPSEIKDVITYISNKRILLIDEDTAGTGSKMLTYCFDVITPENKSLVLFVTKSVYDNYQTGDKLSVTYLTYTNDINVEFPIVLSVKSVDNT